MSDFDNPPGRGHLPLTKPSQCGASGGSVVAATPGKRTRVQELPPARPGIRAAATSTHGAGHADAEHGVAPAPVSARAVPAGAGGPAAPAAVASGSQAAAH